MLQSLTVRNFKLFDEQGITIAPSKITVLIGANGSGKSSIFQALQLLKQNAETVHTGAFQYNGHELTLGSFADVIHNQATEQQVEISINVPYENLPRLEYLTPRVSRNGVYTYTINLMTGNNYSQSCTIHDDHQTYIAVKQRRRPEVTPDEFSFAEGSKIKIEATRIAGRPMEIRLTQSTDSHDNDATISDILMLLSTIQVQLSTSRFTPAIRGFDQLNYEIFSSGARFTDGNNALLRSRALANLIAERPDIAEEVGQKIQQVLGAGSRTLRNRLAGDRVSPEMGLGRKSITLFNEAFGLNQLIPAMVDLVTADQGALVAIEEPEAYLHPRAQAALADTFVEFALNEHKQVMLTTHSEHILMSLLGGVASSRLQPEDLAVYELYREGDTARAKRLAVNQYGQIEGGLREFMEVDIEKVGELVASRFR
jgi:ABC-type cobalamin/Fe3+-siderophores transport system ATPase subunit